MMDRLCSAPYWRSVVLRRVALNKRKILNWNSDVFPTNLRLQNGLYNMIQFKPDKKPNERRVNITTGCR